MVVQVAKNQKIEFRSAVPRGGGVQTAGWVFLQASEAHMSDYKSSGEGKHYSANVVIRRDVFE